LVAVLGLTGCASFIDFAIPNRVADRLSAEALVIPESFTATDTIVKKDVLHGLVVQSLNKCLRFQNRLFANIQEVNTTGDIVSSFLSTVATLATPINSVHALTASAAIVSSSKGAYNADVFANANVTNFNLAIKATYGKAIADYAAALDKVADGNSLDIGAETVKILQAHQLCGLASAEAAIQTQLQPVSTASPIAVTLAFDPNPVEATKPSKLTITLGNTGEKAATLKADFIAGLGEGLTVADPVGVSGTCTSSGTVRALPSKAEISYAKGGAIPAKGCTIQVMVTGSGVRDFVTTVNANAVQTDQGNNPNPVTATLTVKAAANAATVPVSVAMTFLPPGVAPGTPSVLTITLGNTGTKVAKLTADFVDTLPPGLSIAAAANLGGTCGDNKANSITANSGDTKITFKKDGSIPVKGCTIVVTASSSAPNTYSNTVMASQLQTDQGNNADPVTATLIVGAATSPTPVAPTAAKQQPSGTPAPSQDLSTYFKK
jgi:hypothetical protein